MQVVLGAESINIVRAVVSLRAGDFFVHYVKSELGAARYRGRSCGETGSTARVLALQDQRQGTQNVVALTLGYLEISVPMRARRR